MRSELFHKLSIAVVAVFSVFVLIWIGMQAASSTPFDVSLEDQAFTEVKAPNGTIRAAIASNAEATARGLSGLPSLPKNSGMLFVFPNAGVYGFWMKDMDFPIDIVWMNADKEVSGVVAGVKPETYPEIFYPPREIMYVLELNSGGALDHGIATGTKLVF